MTDFEVEYLGRNRVLLIRFVEEIERFRTLNVELLEGITASDGVPIENWALSFFVGGQPPTISPRNRSPSGQVAPARLFASAQ